jgi:hemoglobin
MSIEITARPAIPRHVAHPDITPEAISRMVDEFYTQIQDHPRLGAIFNPRIGDKWPAHLDKLKAFWRSVLLTTGEYYGRPVPAHNGIAELEESDFALWLGLFDKTVDAVFEPYPRIVIKEKARRIARSLWLARFGTPFNQPPQW